jgi:hypothetical protein
VILVCFTLLILFSNSKFTPQEEATFLLAFKKGVDPNNILIYSGNGSCKWKGIECNKGSITQIVLIRLENHISLEQFVQSLNNFTFIKLLPTIPTILGIVNNI